MAALGCCTGPNRKYRRKPMRTKNGVCH